MKRTPPMIAMLLTLVLSLSLAPLLGGQAAGAEKLAAHKTRDNGCPYYIMVNRAQNTVTVYGLDGEGYYTLPVKAMVCSVGRVGKRTPLGTFALTGKNKEWCLMLDGSYGQYSSQFSGYYLFHSVCYSEPDPAALLTEEYNMLGEAASMGCVRLQVADAKWIYDNCAAGTKVTVYEGEEPGPLGKPDKLVEEIAPGEGKGWDPTDPRLENPWHVLLVRELELDAEDITLEAGMRQRLWPQVDYLGTVEPTVIWRVSDPTVCSVDSVGRVTALGPGSALVTAACGSLEVSCAVTVEGELLHFADVAPGSWYYSDVRYAYEKGLFSGTGRATFAPEKAMDRASMVQVLYNLAGRPWMEEGDSWSAGALRWGTEAGILEPGAAQREEPLTRQEMMVMLYRFQSGYWGGTGEAEADLAAFPDGEGLSEPGRTAMSWAVGKGLLQGTSDHRLDPEGIVPRAQAAAILRRYHEMWRA